MALSDFDEILFKRYIILKKNGLILKTLKQ